MYSLVVAFLISTSTIVNTTVDFIPYSRPFSLFQSGSYDEYIIYFDSLVLVAPYVVPWKSIHSSCVGSSLAFEPHLACFDRFNIVDQRFDRSVDLGYRYYDFVDFFKYITYSVSHVRIGNHLFPVNDNFVVYARDSGCCYVFLKRYFKGPHIAYINSTHVYYEDIPSKVLKYYFYFTRFIPLDLSNTTVSYSPVCDTNKYSSTYVYRTDTYFRSDTNCLPEVLSDGTTKICLTVSSDSGLCPYKMVSSYLELQSRFFVYMNV